MQHYNRDSFLPAIKQTTYPSLSILFRAYQSNHHIMRSWNTAVLPLICVLQTGLLSLSPSLSPSLDKHSQSIRYWTHTRSHPLPLISAAHTFPPGQCQSEITEGLCSLWKWEKPQVSSGTHSHSERDGPLNTERFISCYVKEWDRDNIYFSRMP